MLFTKLEWGLLFEIRSDESKVRYGADDCSSRLKSICEMDEPCSGCSFGSAYWTIRIQASCSALYCSKSCAKCWIRPARRHSPKLCVECTVQPPVISVECKQHSVGRAKHLQTLSNSFSCSTSDGILAQSHAIYQ